MLIKILQSSALWLTLAGIAILALIAWNFYKDFQHDKEIERLHASVAWNYEAIKYLCEAAGYDFYQFIEDIKMRV